MSGAEVVVDIGVPLFVFNEFMQIDNESTLSTLSKKYEWFIEKEIVVSWNLCDKKGNPIPIEPGCMDKIPNHLARGIVQSWWKTIIELPSPLEQNSEDGESGEEPNPNSDLMLDI